MAWVIACEFISGSLRFRRRDCEGVMLWAQAVGKWLHVLSASLSMLWEMQERRFQPTSVQKRAPVRTRTPCAAHGELIVERSAKTVQEHWLILVGVGRFWEGRGLDHDFQKDYVAEKTTIARSVEIISSDLMEIWHFSCRHVHDIDPA